MIKYRVKRRLLKVLEETVSLVLVLTCMGSKSPWLWSWV